ncbi:MAG: class I SAM-dependent DNA methyltransferase, partial [Rubritalea sp.]
EKLSAKMDNLQHLETSADASKKDKTAALKEIKKIKATLTELKDWERDVLFPLAQQQIDLDLDDGVKVNYNKFKTDKGLALKKVTGLTGK